MYGGTQQKRRSQHVQGIKALKATGGNFAFEFAPQEIYFLLKHYQGGVLELVKEFEKYKDNEIILNMKEKLSDKFASIDHAGPMDVVNFMDIVDEDEIEFTKRDVYEQVRALVNNI